MPQHINTITISNTTNKCKDRPPTPMPTLFTFPTFSNTDDTASQISNSSTDYNAASEFSNSSTEYNGSSPPRTYYIPMTPPKKQNAMLPRPPHIPRPSRIPVCKTQQTTKNQQIRIIPATQKIKTSPKLSGIPIVNHKQPKPARNPKLQHATNSLPGPCKDNTTRNSLPKHQETKPANSKLKSPLLPTLPAPVQCNRTRTFIPRPPQLQHQQFLPRPYSQPQEYQPALLPSPTQHQIPAFSGPPIHNYYRLHQQPYIPGPYQQSQQNFNQ